MSYGFDKAKKRPETPSPEPVRLDLTGLSALAPPDVTPAQDSAAVAAGDRLGFSNREPMVYVPPSETPAPINAITRVRPSVPTKSILIKGPVGVLDRFVVYTNETKARSYWEVLDELLKAQGR